MEIKLALHCVNAGQTPLGDSGWHLAEIEPATFDRF